MRAYLVCVLWLMPVWAASKCSLRASPTGGARGSAGSGSASGSSSSNSGAYIAAAWYAAWHSSDYTLSNVTWSSYSSMIYAFASVFPTGSARSYAYYSGTEQLHQMLILSDWPRLMKSSCLNLCRRPRRTSEHLASYYLCTVYSHMYRTSMPSSA